MHQSIQDGRRNRLYAQSAHLDLLEDGIERQEVDAVLLDEPEVIDQPKDHDSRQTIVITIIAPATFARQKAFFFLFFGGGGLQGSQQLRDIQNRSGKEDIANPLEQEMLPGQDEKDPCIHGKIDQNHIPWILFEQQIFEADDHHHGQNWHKSRHEVAAIHKVEVLLSRIILIDKLRDQVKELPGKDQYQNRNARIDAHRNPVDRNLRQEIDGDHQQQGIVKARRQQNQQHVWDDPLFLDIANGK